MRLAVKAAGCLGFGALAFMTFIASLFFWPLIVVAFGFLIAAIVMLCIPDRPQPPQVVVQPVPMWWDGRRWRHYR